MAECIVALVKFSICCGAAWLYEPSNIAEVEVFRVLLIHINTYI